MEIIGSWELRGRARRLVKGQLLLLERQLARKFGALPNTVTSRLSQLSSSQLTALGEALLDFTSLSDLERWFASPPPPVNAADEDEDEDELLDDEDEQTDKD